MSKRRIVLLSVLLACVAAAATWAPTDLVMAWEDRQAAKPLAGENAIRAIEVHRAKDGGWIARIDYFYTGQPAREFLVVVQKMSRGPGTPIAHGTATGVLAERGQQRINIRLPRHHEDAVRVTERLEVRIGSTSREVAQRIEWPDNATMQLEREFASNPPEKLLAKAIAMIDTEQHDQLRQARTLLQHLLQRHPTMDQAYLELARIAMKTNWGPEGLQQAEALIGSALQVRADSVNAKILLAYVYAYQKRFRESEPLLVEASRSDTKNLWLWANWGDFYRLQDRPQEAIAKYREAVARPRTDDPNDRARLYAYERMLRLMDATDLDGLEAVHKQRVADYGPKGCVGLSYARFLLLQRGDADGAEALLRQQDATAPCEGDHQGSLQGLIGYLRWSNAKEPERAEALRLARATAPVSASLLLTLASNERVLPVAKQLVAAGEKIDMRDNRQFTALGYALDSRDAATARRLLALGARPTTLVGAEDMPVALLPVLSRDLEAIRLMQRHGVDYTQLRYRGMTAVDHARSIGDAKLLQALDPRSGRL